MNRNEIRLRTETLTKTSVKAVGDKCQLMERCDSMGRYNDDWGGVTTVRKFDSHQGCVKGLRQMCPLMERCDGLGGM